MNVKHFSKNHKGRDFVCGDIHNCWRLLEQKLKEIGFNELTDRLFAVGDCIDRGPDDDCLFDWLNQPFFHSVRGNHEGLLIDAYRQRGSVRDHLFNGGEFFYKWAKEHQKVLVETLEEFPLCIEIETDKGLVGVVHAEVPEHNWNIFREANPNDWVVENRATWARNIIYDNREVWVEGVDRVFVGHSVVDKLTVLGNYHFIDTGSCFTGDLTLVQIN